MIGSSIDTTGSCGFETDKFTVVIGTAEDNPLLGVVLNEDEQLKEGETFMSPVK